MNGFKKIVAIALLLVIQISCIAGCTKDPSFEEALTQIQTYKTSCGYILENNPEALTYVEISGTMPEGSPFIGSLRSNLGAPLSFTSTVEITNGYIVNEHFKLNEERTYVVQSVFDSDDNLTAMYQYFCCNDKIFFIDPDNKCLTEINDSNTLELRPAPVFFTSFADIEALAA